MAVGAHRDNSKSNGTVRAWMEERIEAAESATRRAAQEPAQKVHEKARSELTLRRAESARARTPHESLLLFDSVRVPVPGGLAEYYTLFYLYR